MRGDILKNLCRLGGLFIDFGCSPLQEIRNDVKSLVADRYASHIIRLLLTILTGQSPELSSAIRSKRSKSFNQKFTAPTPSYAIKKGRLIPDSFKAAVISIMSGIFEGMDAKEMSQFALDPVTSPVLQQVLGIVTKLGPELEGKQATDLAQLSGRILGFGETDDRNEQRSPFVEKLLKDQVGSHLLQKLIQTLDKSSFHKLYLLYFRKRLEELAFHPVANFVVQDLILGAKTKVELDMMIEELGPAWEKLLCWFGK